MTTKVNPAATSTDVEMIGKDVQLFTVDYINAVNGSAGPSGVQSAVLDKIMQTATIIAAGPLGNSNTEQTFMTEGADSVVVATLQADIRTCAKFAGSLHNGPRCSGPSSQHTS